MGSERNSAPLGDEHSLIGKFFQEFVGDNVTSIGLGRHVRQLRSVQQVLHDKESEFVILRPLLGGDALSRDHVMHLLVPVKVL